MKILNIGSLNLDFVYAVDHFVRPGETIAAKQFDKHSGGKGLNQSIALAKAKAQVFHAGKVGADGRGLIELLGETGANTELVEIVKDKPTGHAIIQVDEKGQNCIIIFGGANQDISKSDIDGMLEKFEKGDILLLQNEASNAGYAIEQAYKKGMLVALNPSPIDDCLKKSPALKYVHWFILNEIEGFEISQKREPDEILREMKRLFPECIVVLTLGKDGVVYFDGEQKATHGIYEVPVADTTAAGDTFAGYFLAGTARGLPVPKCLELASKASSLAVSRPGSGDSIPTLAEVESTDIKLVIRK
ncbi:MAG: ribokinase [Oscillospiraceae bacterium]